MPLRLPPLSSLRIFEAAGRHLSFKHAAAELHVTPSAVSHAIMALEEALEVALFTRSSRSLALTPAGADYLTYVSEALSLIAIGTQRLPATRGPRRVAVSCAPTFASRWLLPRLAAFRARWPELAVSVDTSQRHVGFPSDGFDFAVRMSRTSSAGPAWTRLFGQRMVPVCSPGYRAAVGGSGEDILRRATLIHVTSTAEDWQAWLDRNGIGSVRTDRGLYVDTMQLACDAAAMGLGVALGRRPFVDSDLRAETLVPLTQEATMAETAYWLVSSEGTEQRADLMAFREWLIQEAHATA